MSVQALSSTYTPYQTPPRFSSSPLQWTVFKIKQLIGKIFGYFLRICIFMLGEISTFGARHVMELYKASESENNGRYSASRVKISEKILLALGAQKKKIPSLDGRAHLTYILFRPQDFARKVYEAGGVWKRDYVNEQPVYLVESPKVPTSAWRSFEKTLEKMSWDKVEKRSGGIVKTCFITCRTPTQLSPLDNPTRVILRTHTQRRAWAMDRKDAGIAIGAGVTFCSYDPRGTYESRGDAPSEEGLYTDAETIYQMLVKRYHPSRIWSIGSCIGATAVSYLKMKHHHEGLNGCLENPFTHLPRVIEKRLGKLSFLGLYSLPSITATHSDTLKTARGSYFNNEKHLLSLKGKPGGKTIIAYSVNDETVGSDEGPDLFKTASKATPCIRLINKDIQKGENGHIISPFRSLENQRAFFAHVFSGTKKKENGYRTHSPVRGASVCAKSQLFSGGSGIDAIRLKSVTAEGGVLGFSTR